METWYDYIMEYNSTNPELTFNTADTSASSATTESTTAIAPKQRGRPKLDVNWPSTDFTFESLEATNKTLSSSSLRKKMRAELTKGGLVKVGTLKVAFGRPKNIYKKSL